MSTPNLGAKSNQSSILSFLHQKGPRYTAPPSAALNGQHQPAAGGVSPSPILPPTALSSSVTSDSAAKGVCSTVYPHPQATIRPISADDITPLRRINSLLLPVSYPESFYQRILDPSASALFSRVIVWSDNGSTPYSTKVIGGIVCRIDETASISRAHEAATTGPILYIESLCLLSAYRSLGLASAALEEVLAAVRRDETLRIQKVYAHAWTENKEGLEWYKSRGFLCHPEPVNGYYIKLRPDTAWIVHRDISFSSPTLSTLTFTSQSPVHLLPATHLSPAASIANLPSRKQPQPPGISPGQSFQNQRPETEWNDLPADMAPPVRSVGGRSGGSSAQSSRSSSLARKRRDRFYPLEAFGS